MRRIAIVVAIIAVLGLAFAWFSRPKPIPVVLKEVAEGKVEATLANTRAGTVEACQRTKLSTIIGGRIEYLGVKEGDRVKKGQLLLKLWNDDQQAQAALSQAQVALAGKRVDEACIAAVNAEKEAKRQAELRDKGFVSSQPRGEPRAPRPRSSALPATPPRPMSRRPRRKLKATRVEQGRVALYAPFDGTVAKIVGEVGEYSTPSPPGVPTPPAIDLIDDSCLYVKAPMDEVDAPKISVGQPVRITLDALPGKILAGQGAARRALCLGRREAGAHGRCRSRFRAAGSHRQAAGRLQRRRRDHPRRSRQGAAHSDRGAAGRRQRAAASTRRAASWKSARSRPGWPTGNTPRCSKAWRPATASSPRSRRRASRPAPG